MTVNLAETLPLLEAMGNLEEVVASFYGACAEKFEADRDFWNRLVAVEKTHARMMREMAQMVKAEPYAFFPGHPFPLQAVATTHRGVEGMIRQVQDGAVTLRQALGMSRDLEQSLLEKNYDSILKSSDLTYTVAMKKVVEDTQNHRAWLDDRVGRLPT